ncbi:hypothetical protein ABZS66_26550 [Dactylosporangium sp. NPDC005572]|uniref:hypothetical protein n=1 Tax=Dactylosporangium sp. NPDC005572 TaxID=3156889 RepID=UPI0033A8E2C6
MDGRVAMVGVNAQGPAARELQLARQRRTLLLTAGAPGAHQEPFRRCPERGG